MICRQILRYFFWTLCFPPFFSTVNSLDLPAHGCYWTESCQSKWFGDCDTGYMLTDQSDNCNGLCGEPSYLPCLPFHTHFHCCKTEIPRVLNKCSRCGNKLDFGGEYICCTDCSDPYIVDRKGKLGYCKTGAALAMQVKLEETFTWVAGSWMKCSSPCDGGVHYRDVGCFRTWEDSSTRQYPVDDSRCSEQEMPVKQEPCNLHACENLGNAYPADDKRKGLSGWLITLLILLGLLATGGLGFAGYTYYMSWALQRWKNMAWGGHRLDGRCSGQKSVSSAF